jgi:hypothetical protein
VHLALFGMQQRTICSYSAASNRTLISVMWAAACTGEETVLTWLLERRQHGGRLAWRLRGVARDVAEEGPQPRGVHPRSVCLPRVPCLGSRVCG